jgi:alcohol dehydrogenase (NADP+)
MLTVNAVGAPSSTEPLTPMTVERRDLDSHDVLIEIKFCGICHSDINHARSVWHPERYPLVPGHEIAGVVTAVGPEVTKHAVGDRVGVGCMVDSCGHCANCLKGEEQYCLSGMTLTFGSVDRHGDYTQGGYSTHIVVKDDFVLRIPDNIPLENAGPLLCAGITTYWPLAHWRAGTGKRVAVIGLGGLGHMAIKIAAAMGAEVAVLSQSDRKREDAIRLGAHEFHVTAEADAIGALADSFDIVINTVSSAVDLDAYMSLVALGGTLANVGAPAESQSFNMWSVLRNRRNLSGSLIGGIGETQEMLDFCGRHHIGADIELIGADHINEAYERVLRSDVRYRFVIDIATIG